MNTSKIEFEVQNEFYIDIFNKKFPNYIIHSFNGWKSLGKRVKKGEKQKAFTIQVNAGMREDPSTGESYMEKQNHDVYGFTADQVE